MFYSLAKNPLFRKEGDPLFIANTRVKSRISKEFVIGNLAHTCSLTEGDITSVLINLEKFLVQYVLLGHSIDLGFFGIGFNVKGGFDSENDTYRHGRNSIQIHAKISKYFCDTINRLVKPVRVKAKSTVPQPKSIARVSGDITVPEFQEGNLVQIKGTNLNFDPNDKETGVYFQSEPNPPVRVTEYGVVGSTFILIKMPNGLTSGNNHVEVRSRAGDGNVMRAVLSDPIVIAA